jgi:hypothetical protein
LVLGRLIYIILFLYQHIVIILNADIAIVVAENIVFAGFGAVDIGMEMKVETLVSQLAFMHFGFAGGIQLRQDTPVLPQDMVHIPDKIVGIGVLFVVVCVAALVGAKLLVGSANKFITAFLAFPFHS